MKKITLYLLLVLALPTGLLSQTATVGTNGADFTTLREAFDFINVGNLTGNVTLYIVDNTIEDATAVLYESGHDGLSSYTSVIIYPTIAGRTISGNIDGPLIDFNGADNITFDGRMNQTGNKDLTIVNTSTGNSASTLHFIESAKSNTIKYCKILGSEGSSSSGIIFFATDATAGGGNSLNTISNDDISGNASSGRPLNVIYSNGSVSPDVNSGNNITNNNIFDFLNNLTASSGIFLNSNTTAWNILGNSFYETTSFVPSGNAAYNIIQINNATGTGFTISGNYIGGQTALCGGSAWAKTSAFDNIFYAINMNVGTGTASSIQNNTIKNFSWSNSAAASWTGINIAGGDVNIGTVTGNIIGSSSSGLVIITDGTPGANVYGINITGTGVINCQHNNIGYFIVANGSSANATNFYGISRALTSTGTTTISNNAISSITASSLSTGTTPQTMYGIYNAGSGTININNNAIASLTNNTTNSTTNRLGLVNGIASSAGAITVSSNTLHDLTIGNANTTATQTASVCGIALTGAVDLKTVTGNTIYSLSNSFATFAGNIIGLYFSGNTGANVVSGNFIHSLTVTGASTTTPSIYGIKMNAGSTTYSNNIINLGGSTQGTIYGIFETGAAGNNNNLYFNTVYIGGTASSGALSSYALYSALITNNRDFRNNIFDNARSNSGGTGKHYAIRIAGTSAALTIDYNDYYAPGTGGVLGLFLNTDRATLALWRASTGKDVNSLNIDPTFTSPGSTNANDYRIVSASLPGVVGTGITIDYGLNPRGTTTVSMGAWEKDINLNKWIGTTSTDWGTTGNWSSNVLPAVDANIIFDIASVNNCNLDIDRSVTDITNGSTNSLVTNGQKLTIKGAMIFTNGAQIDATLTASTVEFAGALAQTIPDESFLNNKVFNVIINNANNVFLNGTLNLLSTITATSGRLDATTNTFFTPTVIYGGSGAQSLEANRFLNDKIYNLTIDNGTGVSVNTNFTLDNNLIINSGKLLIITSGKLLTVSGTIANNAGTSGLVIKSDATGDGKLINNNSPISGTVELFLSGGQAGSGASKFHYIVPPVATMSFNNASPATVAADLGLTFFNGDLASYSEVAAGPNKDAGWQYFDGYDYGYGPTTPFSSLVSSTGYNIFLTSDDKITFKGTLNSTDHTFSDLSFSRIGWNLVGNPYPCNYDLNGIPELTDNGGSVNNTIYFNHDGGFAYWNVLVGGSTGYSDIVAPMQGFFVHVSATGQSITLPASSKTATTAAPLRSKGTDTVKKIKLVLNNGPVPDETIVCLIDKATTGFDGDFDGYKLFGKSTTTEPYIYTQIDAIQYAINAVPEPTSTPLVIPVTVVLKTTGTYKIDITEFQNLDGFNVVLKHGTVETTLSKDAFYSFTLAAGTYTDFQLIFSNISTAVEKQTIEKFKSWYNNNYLYINCPEDISADNGKLVVYDIQGKIVYNNNQVSITPGQTNQVALNLQKGVYVTNFIVNNQRFVSKIVVF